MVAENIAFGILAAAAVLGALRVVTTKNVVHAALWLVVTLASVAGGYLMMTAEFLAWVQVLIYIGSIVVLLLFGIMLTKAPIGGTAGLDSENRLAAGVVATALGATLVTLVIDAFRHAYIDLETFDAGDAEATGMALFRHYVLPFEVVSIVLLAALIGSIVLSRRDEEGR